MIDGSEKRNRQLAFELQNSHVCEKRSKIFHGTKASPTAGFFNQELLVSFCNTKI